jgi:hypothetical protein
MSKLSMLKYWRRTNTMRFEVWSVLGVAYLRHLLLCFVEISIDSPHSAAAKNQTPDVTYYNTTGNIFTILDNSIKAEYSDVR